MINDDSQQAFSIDEISDWQAFHALAPEWNQLLSNSNTDNYFFTYEWISIWIKHFCSESKPFILIAREKETGELLGAAPLVIEEKRNFSGLFLRELSFLGNGLLEIDHLDFIINKKVENEISEAFAKNIHQQKNRWDKIFFDGLASSSKVLQKLLSYSDHSLIYEESCPYLPLPDNWTSLKQTFGKNLRYNLGRYKRKLQKNHPGTVSYQIVKSENELARVMSKLYQLHSSEKKDLFKNRIVEEFNNEISKYVLETGNLRFYSLNVEEKIIAVLYCFRYKDTILFYQSGYDSEWQNYSPGRLLMAYAIKNAISEKAKEFDFLRGNEDYKNSWTGEFRTETRVHLPSSFKGRLSLLPLTARRVVKKILS